MPDSIIFGTTGFPLSSWPFLAVAEKEEDVTMKCFDLLLAAAICCGVAHAQPGPKNVPTSCGATKIISVENAASGDGSAAPGSLSRITWCDFELPSPTTPVTAVTVHGLPAFVTFQDFLPTSPITSVVLHSYPSFRPREIVVQMPNLGLPLGPSDIHLLRGASIVAATTAQITDFAPAIFTFDRQPTGPAVALNPTGYIFGSNLLHVGSTVTILTEGLGATTPFVPTGAVPGFSAVTVTTPEVFVGNQPAAVVESKLSEVVAFPSAAGMYEVTFVVPPVNTSKMDQPIYLRIGSKKSNTATLPVVP